MSQRALRVVADCCWMPIRRLRRAAVDQAYSATVCWPWTTPHPLARYPSRSCVPGVCRRTSAHTASTRLNLSLADKRTWFLVF